MLSELKAAAEAATPGPWRHASHAVVLTDTGNGDTDTIVVWDDTPKNVHFDTKYIALANPQTILKLIDRIAELEKEVAVLREDAERYRWLRGHLYTEDACLEIGINIYCHECPNLEDINIAIDAARRAK